MITKTELNPSLNSMVYDLSVQMVISYYDCSVCDGFYKCGFKHSMGKFKTRLYNF